ncbi:unnamed protein product [Mytilus edulis]|uniref:Uncharacterized protein n=1 Tax=Mytilus edulis TaxID=6550 RepID=A0A8S3S0A6_MYTED|nr:unnamed protein product [Mytilus edulis]
MDMKCLLPLLILFNCRSIQGVFEWTVFGKVTEYGQNVTLFCNVSNCCPNYAGWDRWTPVQQTLFIDVKTGQANAKYDGKALQNGYTLVIQNLSKSDLNVSYSCVYGAIFGKRKFLLEGTFSTSFYYNWNYYCDGGCCSFYLLLEKKKQKTRQKLLEKLKQLNKSKQISLVNTKDTVIPKTDCGSGNTPLIGTCYYDYTDMVQWLLSNDVDVDQCRDDGASGLFMASQEGHTDIIKLLLERNPEVNLCAKNGCSPLLQASQNGHTDIVRLLLERKPDVNLCGNDGMSPLLQASQNGHTDIVKLLLEKNPDVNLCDNDGYSPLILASNAGHTDIVRLLLERNPDTCNNTQLSTPYVNNNTRMSNSPSLVQPLLKHQPDINAQTFDGGNALYFSTLNGNLEITQLLLENNANCNICIHSKKSMTDILNTHRSFTLNKAKQNLFDSLVKTTSSRVTEYVSNKPVDYALDVVAGCSPLHIACFMGRTDIVRCLIDYNANINMTKEDGTTPLFYACEVGYEDIVRLLLDNGADTQICRMDEKFPLDIATENGHTSIEMILNE